MPGKRFSLQAFLYHKGICKFWALKAHASSLTSQWSNASELDTNPDEWERKQVCVTEAERRKSEKSVQRKLTEKAQTHKSMTTLSWACSLSFLKETFLKFLRYLCKHCGPTAEKKCIYRIQISLLYKAHVYAIRTWWEGKSHENIMFNVTFNPKIKRRE